MSGKESCGNPSNARDQRPPRNLLELYVTAVDAAGNSAPSNDVPQLDEERKKFIEGALSSLTVNVAKILSAAIEIIKTLQNPESEQLDESDYEQALDRIGDCVDDIDNANDFFKLGGFDLANICLESKHSAIRWRFADILAQCTQNNPYCQLQAVSMNIIPKLLKMVDNDETDICKVKAFFAVSCIVRDNPEALKQFVNSDGFSVVLRAMQSTHERLSDKASVFLSSVTSRNPEIKDVLFKMGFVEQLVTLIGREHKSNHEYLTLTLLQLIDNHKEAQAECRRPELQLEQTLNNIINEYGTDEAYLEEMEYIKDLLLKLFSGSSEEER